MTNRFLAASLTQVRLNARHGIPPMDAGCLREYCAANGTTPVQVREAEKQGRDLRASGARCMCPFCESNGLAIVGKERLRQHHAARRNAQLRTQGVDNYEERSRMIEREIDAWAAFQAVPVKVTRTA
ncbi:MAG: hypothetical protein F9K35_03615 [Burkholderiaceae bacterium]|nr:MAG: hypothetical protein F9K35_03615 [Burkholderiaceae bacterium]